MKKIITSTPIPALVIFVLFIFLFNTLTNNYYVDSYSKCEFKINKMERSTELIDLEIDTNVLLKKGDKINLIYSSQEQVIKGEIVMVKNNDITVVFKGINKLEDVQIEQANIEICTGKQSIGSVLKLWK